MIEKLIVLSLVSGEVYEIEADEIKTLELYHAILKEYPKSNCSQCHGRGIIGLNVANNFYEPCMKCLRKCLDTERTNEIAKHKKSFS